MANTYYKYSPVRGGLSIQLTAIEPQMAGEEAKNMIIISIGELEERHGICLNEQEQDDLIAGILERRSVPVHITHNWLEEYTHSQWRGDSVPDISATGYGQSSIHPADKE